MKSDHEVLDVRHYCRNRSA